MNELRNVICYKDSLGRACSEVCTTDVWARYKELLKDHSKVFYTTQARADSWIRRTNFFIEIIAITKALAKIKVLPEEGVLDSDVDKKIVGKKYVCYYKEGIPVVEAFNSIPETRDFFFRLPASDRVKMEREMEAMLWFQQEYHKALLREESITY